MISMKQNSKRKTLRHLTKVSETVSLIIGDYHTSTAKACAPSVETWTSMIFCCKLTDREKKRPGKDYEILILVAEAVIYFITGNQRGISIKCLATTALYGYIRFIVFLRS